MTSRRTFLKASLTHVNLVSLYDGRRVRAYGDFLKRCLDQFAPSFVSFNHYLRANLPAWTYIQSVDHWNLKRPTMEELQWQISMSLAYGCKLNTHWLRPCGRELKHLVSESVVHANESPPPLGATRFATSTQPLSVSGECPCPPRAPSARPSCPAPGASIGSPRRRPRRREPHAPYVETRPRGVRRTAYWCP